MKVKNINGRRQNSCRCGTWLDHWVRICGRPIPQHCAQARCLGKPELGAHVQKDSSTDTDWYIIPLCVKHSIKAESLEILDTTVFVSAHVSETCVKQRPIGDALPHELQAAMARNTLPHGKETATAQVGPGHAKPAAIRRHDQLNNQPKERPDLMEKFYDRNGWIECGL
jgi:hypothetical protein